MGAAHWLLKIASSTSSRQYAPPLIFDSKAKALNATLGLWKRGFRAVAIHGPDGEYIDTDEIERFQNDDLKREFDER